MHPDSCFHVVDRDRIRDFVRRRPFGMLFAQTPERPAVVHLPVVWLDDDRLGLHLSARNRVAPHLDGARVLFVANGANAYVSADWYGQGPQKVPTWNYAAVELDGRLTRMSRAALEAQIGQLAAEQEARLAPKQPWTGKEVPDEAWQEMLGEIVGFVLDVDRWRGTLKAGQNKPEEARLRAADALDAQGATAAARLMRELTW